jgi:hypothetical protein
MGNMSKQGKYTSGASAGASGRGMQAVCTKTAGRAALTGAPHDEASRCAYELPDTVLRSARCPS